MPHKRDVDVFSHHRPCIHCLALQTMHHVSDAGRCVIYLFYFLALPFYYPFIFSERLFYSNIPDLQAKVYTSPGFTPRDVMDSLDIQQLLLGIAFACQAFCLFFFFGNFAYATDICTGSNWNQTTNNQVFVDTNQFVG